MTDKEQSQRAKEFAKFWKDKGYEKGQSQTFWLQLLSQVYGIEKPEEFIEFEDQVHIDKNTGFIDGYIPLTKVLIEQKSIDKDLRKGIRQSDGSLLNPFQQAKKYIAELPLSMHPKYVITCNFKSFLIYNMENPNGEPEEILLENLEKEYYRLQFLIETGNEHLKREMEISIQAGELVGKLYDEILKLYINPENEETLKSLNMLCVRLVFCLYAEDSGIFGKRLMFHDYLTRFESRDLRRALIDLFRVLDTKIENRDSYISEELAQFPYVNGGLFADEEIEIPNLNDTVKELLLSKASEDFDWSEISPTIFGAVFESTLNPETRRKGGMHYTSIENIHKVIDPLFLDDLKEELQEIKQISVIKTRKKKLTEFQDKLASLKFLDPACGSGNFLTETYLSLRKLENEVIFELTGGQIGFGDESFSPIKVSIGQFYGIEINDFAVTVAKTALWIAESQMMKETENILHITLDFLPLKSYTNIIEGNALRIDWNDVVPREEVNYIMGNPPFVGARLMNESQKEDISNIFKGTKGSGNLDYVSCWYKKATYYIENTNIEVAFVSTNSITQGEQVAILWKDILEKGVNINFAYRTFRWDSEASLKAHVHCVIIGFSFLKRNEKYLYENDSVKKATNINPYLIDAPNVYILGQKKPICNVAKMDFGSMPNDGGYLSDYDDEKKELIVSKYPESEKMFKRFIGATEFLHNKIRWCLWLKNISPNEIKKVIPVYEAVQNVQKMRINSNREATRRLADMPTLFGEIRQPETNYLVIPRHSSENRRYIPIGYIDVNIICGDANLLIPSADLFDFGILMSNVHNSWIRAIAGRIKSDYRYSASVVYNTFPWCNPTEEQKKKIEKTAQAILDARTLYPNSSLADLYDELTMPRELRKAHQENDKAVMEAYGFNWKKMTESDCVAELMKMYEKLTKNKEGEIKKMIKLKKVEIDKYKSFLEKQEIEIEEGVTRIVGKNESGKTALLEALAKFNYFDSQDKSFDFNSINDYPRGLLKKYQQEYPNDDFSVITCTFELSEDLLKQISDDIGKDVYTDRTIKISKKYNNGMTYSISANCKKFIENFLQKYTIEESLKEEFISCNSVKELAEKLKNNEELQTLYNELETKYIKKSVETFNDVVAGYIVKQYIDPNLPQFLYFDEYYALPGTINLNKFSNGQVDDTFPKEQQDITKALFELSNIDISKVMNSDDYEDFIAELEATSNNITDKLLEYWTTNQNLEIKFEIQTKENPSSKILEKFLQIRIRNTKHRVTLPLKNRSKGFIWFFSFLVWFSKVQEKDNLIILLDEPGLNLHAEAQSDLLKYIDKELLPRYQVIYTTHSPFMIESDKLDEVRTVYDSNNSKIGSVISSALEEKDQGTLFPLQAALGYNLAQNLYISDKNLLVEGVADLMYLTVISGILNSSGRVGLNDDITIVPVGGLDKVATFISLLRGNKLNMACLLDTFTDQKGKKRLEDLIKDKIIKENQVKFFDQYIERLDIADIEDMFEVDEYLNLFNEEFANEFTKINVNDIDDTKAIIPQINRIINKSRFNHYRPSRYLTSICADKDYFSEGTLNRFENLFKDINNLFK